MHFVKTLIKQFFLEDLVVWRKIMAETFFETMFENPYFDQFPPWLRYSNMSLAIQINNIVYLRNNS